MLPETYKGIRYQIVENWCVGLNRRNKMTQIIKFLAYFFCSFWWVYSVLLSVLPSIKMAESFLKKTALKVGQTFCDILFV